MKRKSARKQQGRNIILPFLPLFGWNEKNRTLIFFSAPDLPSFFHCCCSFHSLDPIISKWHQPEPIPPTIPNEPDPTITNQGSLPNTTINTPITARIDPNSNPPRTHNSTPLNKNMFSMVVLQTTKTMRLHLPNPATMVDLTTSTKTLESSTHPPTTNKPSTLLLHCNEASSNKKSNNNSISISSNNNSASNNNNKGCTSNNKAHNSASDSSNNTALSNTT